MKLLVFAHTPPPHHGQSFMVQVMLEGFGGDYRKTSTRRAKRANSFGIQCYHVNARVSKHLEDIGDFRVGKFLLMLGYCLQAIWCRFRYGVTNLYYVPAPGKKSALYRDWLVMALCRPFYKRVILHWHASGLGKWLETVVQLRSRSITYSVAGGVDLSIVLSNYGRADAEKLYPKQVAVVGNGVEDPCPQFTKEVLPLRKARVLARQKALAVMQSQNAVRSGVEPLVYRVLYVSHCSRDKGLFEAVHGVLLANKTLRQRGLPITMHLTVAGEFLRADEKAEFDQIVSDPAVATEIQRVGFVTGDEKHRLYVDADVFCFPSYLESFGLVLAEAMAYGLPVVATRCGALPEVVPPGYPGLVSVRSASEVAEALVQTIAADNFEELRNHYEKHYTLERHLNLLASALNSLNGAGAEQFVPGASRPAFLMPR